MCSVNQCPAYNGKNTLGKRFINSIQSCADESLSGFVCSNDLLRYISGHRIVIRSDHKKFKECGKVAILSGGGAGHEPFPAGFVGEGLLTAAVVGTVFNSPTPTSIFTALRVLGKGNKAGTIVIAANYTGDRLNFGLATERAKAEGHRVEMVLVKDDCALISADKSAGRRGLCGIVLFAKVAGAMSECGCSLEEIVAVLGKVNANLGSIGLGLGPCNVPALGPYIKMKDDEVDLGLGIRGEPGVSRIKMDSAKELVDLVFTYMTNPESATCIALSGGDRVALLVNNMGGTSNLEMNIIAWEAINWLESHGVIVSRVFCASVLTTLNLHGFMLTVLRTDEQILHFIDVDTHAPCWPRPYQNLRTRDVRINRSDKAFLSVTKQRTCKKEKVQDKGTAIELNKATAKLFMEVIQRACASIIDARAHLNDLDTGCGDGDTGDSLSCGAEAILDAFKKTLIDIQCPFWTLQQLSKICQHAMGSTSGSLYGVFLNAASAPLKCEFTLKAWRHGLRLGAEAITKYGGAKRGDRTMLDSLMKATDALKRKKDEGLVKTLSMAAQAAEEGANDTAAMKAKVGRASHVSPDCCTRNDPGAEAVAIIFRSVSDTIANAQERKPCFKYSSCCSMRCDRKNKNC